MADDDKYPNETGRRRFVKGVVGAGALAAVGTGGAAAVGTATNRSGSGGGITSFRGIENTDGPAPRGMPIVPVEVGDDGVISGVWPEVQEVDEGGQTIQVAEMDIGGVTYSTEWFQYCGVQTYEGIEPGYESDNILRSAPSPPPAYTWQTEAYSGGDPLNIADFEDYRTYGNGIGSSGLGKPAMATWRSQDTESTIPVQVLRSPRVEEMAQNDEFVAAATDQGVMAWLDKCTHFCCVPAFKGYEGSAGFDAEDRVYCQCHQSVYNPFSIVESSFVSLPRPE
ncbi:Rieske 2Fe-2S domain-containing protein [Halomarina oriensis]|uniref:Rieske 2Fe-2S domain-containing protein n=1 Tax=Halomarina oriensis TaxID=671145 RepID=A0A6B0GH75_9EURY|nr:Rieske 2Fe-2S domain-containing protein [Halomarina oriensis]MWG33307.1 Rieske 2Fe-2S domain-containing protein [Halomarina oriensis]